MLEENGVACVEQRVFEKRFGIHSAGALPSSNVGFLHMSDTVRFDVSCYEARRPVAVQPLQGGQMSDVS